MQKQALETGVHKPSSTIVLEIGPKKYTCPARANMTTKQSVWKMNVPIGLNSDCETTKVKSHHISPTCVEMPPDVTSQYFLNACREETLGP